VFPIVLINILSPPINVKSYVFIIPHSFDFIYYMLIDSDC